MIKAMTFGTGWRQMMSAKNGAGERSRTLDLRITSALLYQLSYTGTGCPFDQGHFKKEHVLYEKNRKLT
jgi:hypothetical protein